MGRKYEDKLDEATKIIFKVSQHLNNLFNFSLVTDSKKDKLKTIKEILKIQKRCYKMIEKYNLNDYKGGTYRCYPGGTVDTYKPHSDKQNVLDMIDYFFVNNGYINAKEFTKTVSPLLHTHEFGESLSMDDYVCNIEPKKFYNADCWQEFLKQGLIDTNILDAHIPLSQEKINKINNQYSPTMQVKNNSCEKEL